MDECQFAEDIKDNILPTKKQVIGYYFFVRNRLMCSSQKYLHRRPEFNVCKDEVLDKIEFIWRKGSLPIMGRKSMETKLKKLLEQFSTAKARSRRKNNVDLQQFESLFDVCSCKCNNADVVEKYGKIACKCPVEHRIPIKGKVCFEKYEL